jgi:hypothetical protein
VRPDHDEIGFEIRRQLRNLLGSCVEPDMAHDALGASHVRSRRFVSSEVSLDVLSQLFTSGVE